MENNFSPIQFYVDSTEKLFHEFHDFLICNVSTDCVKANTYALSSFFFCHQFDGKLFYKKYRRLKESRYLGKWKSDTHTIILVTYSRVHISSDEVFSKILKKPSIFFHENFMDWSLD